MQGTYIRGRPHIMSVNFKEVQTPPLVSNSQHLLENMDNNNMILDDIYKDIYDMISGEMWKWVWEKCGNQSQGFGRNVEINDMVLGKMWKSIA